MTHVQSTEAYEILVPMFYNSGVKVHVDHHRAWDHMVQDMIGGLTIFRASRGKWVNNEDGTVYEERMIPVRLFCSRKEIEAIAEMTLKHYNQIAIAVLKISEEALIFKA